ncbi:sirohydrochlorin cobaltochelatase [Enterococcus sp. PF1-24]|uniref:sirohydrochlorin cobaltochelatase n=1 Tax=unclassified Enterococcus TaxID=2608891 RepID=UPI002474C7E1|nr:MULTISPECIES: sirohydrochlorin cobaltochelatase [unclassified Enterococcus]MDH6363378.1 sirohydrochlorin cobaltochelatase [Enterococcus sp. PFB1-1]MDH6400321.1 sirohydrochlorin cobaltochelatase [Enterococcus sp. PF1-24]
MKKALIAVSFGTSYPETRAKNIEVIENRLAETFPEYDVFRAFTSTMVIKKIKKEEGNIIPTVAELLPQLAAKGYQEVYVQPLHIIPGIEYSKAMHQAYAFHGQFKKIKVGKPLLTSFEDYQVVINWLADLAQDLPAEEALVLMGHGSQHSAFTTYACLDHMLLNKPIYVCAVESYPEITSVIQRLQAANYQKIHLYPLMLVAGDHATNDMASTEPDSWKSQLEAVDFEVSAHLKGMGEATAIQDLFIDHAQEMLSEKGEVDG